MPLEMGIDTCTTITTMVHVTLVNNGNYVLMFQIVQFFYSASRKMHCSFEWQSKLMKIMLRAGARAMRDNKGKGDKNSNFDLCPSPKGCIMHDLSWFINVNIYIHTSL